MSPVLKYLPDGGSWTSFCAPSPGVLKFNQGPPIWYGTCLPLGSSYSVVRANIDGTWVALCCPEDGSCMGMPYTTPQAVESLTMIGRPTGGIPQENVHRMWVAAAAVDPVGDTHATYAFALPYRLYGSNGDVWRYTNGVRQGLQEYALTGPRYTYDVGLYVMEAWGGGPCGTIVSEDRAFGYNGTTPWDDVTSLHVYVDAVGVNVGTGTGTGFATADTTYNATVQRNLYNVQSWTTLAGLYHASYGGMTDGRLGSLSGVGGLSRTVDFGAVLDFGGYGDPDWLTDGFDMPDVALWTGNPSIVSDVWPYGHIVLSRAESYSAHYAGYSFVDSLGYYTSEGGSATLWSPYPYVKTAA